MNAEDLIGTPLFAGVQGDELEPWAERFDEHVVLSGTGLARQDDYAYRFFVVLDGEVDIGREYEPVARLGPGDFFGEAGLLGSGRRNARVIARSQCRLASMMLWDFRAMLDALPVVADRIERQAVARTPPGESRDAD